MKAQSKLNTKINNKKNLLKEEGNIRIEALYNIILTESGKPDYLAIDIYTEARSWYKPKKTNIQGNIVYSSKLSGYGWQIGYEYLANKHKCTTELIRRKLVLLEKLGLLTRDFRTEYYHGKRFNNNMYLLVWKDTPHFYSEIGLEKKVVTTPQNQVELCKNSCPPLQQKLDNIYVIPNNGKKKKEEAKAYSSSFFSSTPIEVNTPLACAREGKIQPYKIVQISNTKPEPAPQEPIIEVPTLAISSLAELAKVYQAEEIRVVASKVVNCDQLEEQPYEKIVQLKSRILVEETASISSEEGSVNTGRIDQITQLKGEIFKAFDSKTSEEIMENCTFTELEPNKLGISIQAKFSLNIGDKEKVKTCIRAVYGGDIQMVSTLSQNKREITQAKPQEVPIKQIKTEWESMKHQIAEYFPENQYNHVKNTWLDHLCYSHASQDQIVIVGRGFYVDYIADKFATAIEFIVKQTKKSLVFQYEGNAQRPIEFKYKR